MKQKIKYLVAGVLIGATIAGAAGVFASNYDDWIDVAYRNIKIVVNGKEIHPSSEPFISEGTTYLPVRDVAEALGQPVDWDGPNFTVTIGSNPGPLPHPTVLLSDVDNIGSGFQTIGSGDLTDNYGNNYSYAYRGDYGRGTFETLLNMKYKRFKATLYVPKGCSSNDTAKIIIKTDGKIVYTSPEITKTSYPIDVDVDITGCNDFQIEVTGERYLGYIADGGFYQ